MDTLPPARSIPAAFTASVRSWWNTGDKESAIAEERLLRRLPFFRPSSSNPDVSDASPPVTATSSKVQLDTPGHYINTVSFTATNPLPDAPPPAVILHGYGAGLGFFFKNFPPLASWAGRRGTNVYAIDWLGMGRSARVPFTVKAKREDVVARVTEAESFFVESLEEWRKKMGLNQMTLIGHSLGGYLSTVYALRYPDRVNKLILLSPAGVPRGPDYTEPSRELNDEGPNPDGHQSSPVSAAERSTFQRATRNRLDAVRKEQKETKARESTRRRLFTYLWEEGWSPFQVIRSSFVWAPMLVGSYSKRRFPSLTEDEVKEIHEYILNITLAKGSGEYCISHILAPGAFARLPLVDRVHALKNVPITWAYGSHDWMDPLGGAQAVEIMKQNGNHKGELVIVPDAGHHLYIDNSTAVNKLLISALDS